LPFLLLNDLSSVFPSRVFSFHCLVRFLANLFAGTLASQRCLDTFLFTGFQVKGVAFNLFNNVFLLHLALKAAQGVFEGFTLLQSNFRQTDTPPNPSGRTPLIVQEFDFKSSRGGELLLCG
jgi:hypothetical protein